MSMNILLISPLQDDAGIQNFPHPSIGIMRIYGYIKKSLPSGINVFLYDSIINHYDLRAKYLNVPIYVLGISVLNYTLPATIKFLNEWKVDHPESIIVCGGIEATTNYETIFNYTPTDICVLGEGEETFAEIIHTVETNLSSPKKYDINFSKIPGTISRKYQKQITNDALWSYWKDTDFRGWQLDKYQEEVNKLYSNNPKETYVRLITVSHCNKNCIFCSLSGGRSLACGKNVLPAALTGQQIFELVNKINIQLPNVKGIYFITDDVFYPYPEYFKDFMELYLNSELKGKYDFLIQTSVKMLTEERVGLLEKIGCKHITIGVESAVEKLRIDMGKHFSQDTVEEKIQLCLKHGILPYILIILMPPKTTMADLWESYHTLIKWIEMGAQISIEPLIYPYRATQVYNTMKQYIYYETISINNQTIQVPKWVLPIDPETRKFAIEFKKTEKDFMDKAYKNMEHKHHFKGSTGKLLLEHLYELLNKNIP